MNDRSRPVVIAVDDQHDLVVDADRWAQLAGDVLGACGVTAGEMNLLFVDADAIRRLNFEHLGRDRPTDVLAFPLDGQHSQDPTSMIGDIVICPSVASANSCDAAGPGRAVDDELALLVVHGVLHVLGHDHKDDDDAEVMQSLERRLLAEHHR